MYAFGLIGNSLSFAVLHKYTSGNVGTYLLKALAVTDNIFLAVTLISARIEPVVPEKDALCNRCTTKRVPVMDCLDDSACRRQSLHRSVSSHDGVQALHNKQSSA